MEYRKYKHHFLDEWKALRKVFIRPKLHWFFGSWYKEPNLPVWRRGPQIRWGKPQEINETWSYAKITNSEWNELGKKNHPILSKIIKRPTWQLPIWLAFHWYNDDIMYKTKWSEDDFRYEFPAHFTIVFFGLAISVTAYIPQENNKDWTCNDDYWEALLSYKYYGGDLKKVNESMGWYNSVGDPNFRFRFNPRFLKNIVDRDDLESIQKHELAALKRKQVYVIKMTETYKDALQQYFIPEHENKLLVYKTKAAAEAALENLKEISKTINGSKMKCSFSMFSTYMFDLWAFNKKKLPKAAIINKDIDILKNIKNIDTDEH